MKLLSKKSLIITSLSVIVLTSATVGAITIMTKPIDKTVAKSNVPTLEGKTTGPATDKVPTVTFTTSSEATPEAPQSVVATPSADTTTTTPPAVAAPVYHYLWAKQMTGAGIAESDWKYVESLVTNLVTAGRVGTDQLIRANTYVVATYGTWSAAQVHFDANGSY